MHNTIEDLDELEETLSLCDLPLYSSTDQSADWDQNFLLPSNSSQQDYFEFFSQELSPSSTAAAAPPPPENIIFCGKLIPYKKSPTIQAIKGRKNYWQFFRWKIPKIPKRQEFSKNCSGGTTTASTRYNVDKLGKGGGKMSVFTASPSVKGKWYFFMFGISRFAPVVELRDIKRRQGSLRRQSPTPPPPAAAAVFGSPNYDEKVINNDRGWGLWGLIRALSCGGNHQRPP